MDLIENLEVLCCDTIASIMGRLKDPYILLEQKLKRDILYLLYKHVIREIILRNDFKIKIDIASAIQTYQFLNVSKNLGLLLTSKTFMLDEKYLIFLPIQDIKGEFLIFCINKLQ